jgi:4a-hydroxytetrahydrobiopterin dehydratase
MKKMNLLTKKEIKKVTDKFPEWKLDAKETKLSRTVTFEKQIDALIFIARTTVNSEILKHHPDILFTYLQVKMTITSHEAKGLTKNDVVLLNRLEQILTSQKSG